MIRYIRCMFLFIIRTLYADIYIYFKNNDTVFESSSAAFVFVCDVESNRIHFTLHGNVFFYLFLLNLRSTL